MALAFDMNVMAIDAFPVDALPLVDEVWPISRLEEFMAEVDVVVVAAPLTVETRHLIGVAQLALMKPDAYLIVVSRGGIVDEAALAETLVSVRLAGAALDVNDGWSRSSVTT